MRTGAGSGRRAAKIAGVVVAAIVAVLVLAQLLGPGIAAKKVRDQVGRYGRVLSVSVSAWPAVKLLFGDADQVRVRAEGLTITPEQTVALLKEGRGTQRIDASARSVREGSLQVTDASLRKRGSALWAQGQVSEADVRRALPEGVRLALVNSAGGTIEVRASGGLFGVRATVGAVAGAEGGALVARPVGFPLSAFKLTVFDDPSIYVEGVHARALAPVAGEGARYELSMWGRLR